MDTFWAEVSVPVTDLAQIAISAADGDTGAQVELHQTGWDATQKRRGRVLRLILELDSDSRMARLLIEVDDPLALRDENAGLSPIMVNDYIRVRIAGEPIPDVIDLPRNLLHNGDTVWIMASDNTLEIPPVEVMHRAGEHVLIKAGIDSDDRIITVDMSTPVAGTPLRVQPAVSDTGKQVTSDARVSRLETGS